MALSSRKKDKSAMIQVADKKQIKAFRRAAHELSADKSDERFKDVLRKIAKARPQPEPKKARDR
jgi:hypothetical protein